MSSFQDTDGDGVPNVPTLYADSLGRKVVEDSYALKNLLKQPNKYAFILAALFLLVVVLVLLLLLQVVKLVRKLLGRSRGSVRSKTS